ncbi:uncharacterized protein PV06_03283 [Exophiala oligosperma]|uniref:Uncharacterized protein n=1 Tax=Exophiala oligosperma TaxID=215243 RepID=A0A0D2DQU4_9EURO|nr:uncharacterized protein PV06_03283 [Exophiala oligosperma]KIW44840.1 hypothetical protein PV06_03283 [Exophiala oligosperma]
MSFAIQDVIRILILSNTKTLLNSQARWRNTRVQGVFDQDRRSRGGKIYNYVCLKAGVADEAGKLVSSSNVMPTSMAVCAHGISWPSRKTAFQVAGAFCAGTSLCFPNLTESLDPSNVGGDLCADLKKCVATTRDRLAEWLKYNFMAYTR